METTLNRAINSTYLAIKNCENNNAETHWHVALHASRTALQRENVASARDISRRIADLVGASNTGFDEAWEGVYNKVSTEFNII